MVRQETDSGIQAEPHGVVSVSLWFPKINSFLPVAAFTSHSHGHEVGKPIMENTPIWIRDSNQNNVMQNFFAPYLIRVPESESGTGYTRAQMIRPVRISTTGNEMSVELVLLNNFERIHLPFGDIPEQHPSPAVMFMKALGNVEDCKIPNLRMKFKGLENSIEIRESETITLPSGWRQVITPDSGAQAGFAWVEFEMYTGMPSLGFSSFTMAGTMQKNMKRTFSLYTNIAVGRARHLGHPRRKRSDVELKR